MDLRNYEYTRKPVTEQDVNSTILLDSIPEDQLEKLVSFDSQSLWGIDEDPIHLFTKEILNADIVIPTSFLFIYTTDEGTEYLINTEGYNYMRYAARIVYMPE